jgi:hypothetical protein
MPVWTWYSGSVNRYRDARGRFVSAATIRSWGQASIDGNADLTADLARRVAGQEISLEEWQDAMRQALKAEMTQQYLLGRGGQAQMTAQDRGSIGGMLAEQYRYLDGFAARIAAGQHSEAQIAAIARMYFNSTREAFERGMARTRGILKLPAYPGDASTPCLTACRCFWDCKRTPDGGWACTWTLTPAAESCETCVERAERWAPYVVPEKDLLR